MTFGIGSEGFDPFYCPPCLDGNLCNTMCIDVIDGPVLILGLMAIHLAIFYIIIRREDGENDNLRTDGGHLPSDPSAADQQATWRNYEERHVSVRFERLWCGDCNTHREHRIEHDHLRGFGETECRSCHTVVADKRGGGE